MSEPQRIVSLLSSATEMLYLLGLGDRVVGVSHECNFPTAARRKPKFTRSNINSSLPSLAIDRQVKEQLAFGKPLYEIDIPQLLALQPDLIVTQAQCDVCAVRYDDVLSAVQHHPELGGVPVVALNPCSLGDVLTEILKLAGAAGVSNIGQQVVAHLSDRRHAVQTRAMQAAQIIGCPRVACIEWTNPLMLAANWMPEMVALAGGRHDLTQGGVHSGYANWQSLIDYNPQVIVVMPCGFPLPRAVDEALVLTHMPGWANIAAVQNGRVYAVDADAYFNRPGPRLVDSLELLAYFIHPEFFEVPATVNPRTAFQALPQSEGVT